MDLNFSVVGPLMIVVRNDGCIMHIKGVGHNGGLFGGGGGGNTATLVRGFFEAAALAAAEGFILEDISLWVSLGVLATLLSAELSLSLLLLPLLSLMSSLLLSLMFLDASFLPPSIVNERRGRGV